jgi:fibronectin-binding autotransporter adhesin
VIWDGGSNVDDRYVTQENWNPDTVPANAANQFLQINDGSTALVQTGDAAEGAFLMLGMRPGDSGHLSITGGTMTLGEMRVGGRETINNNLADWTLGTFDPNGGGTGAVTQTGGDVSITFSTGTEPPIQSLYIGDSGLATGNTANGSYTISNNATLTSGIAADDAIVVGTGSGTVGAFTQSDNSIVTSTGFLTIGRVGATGTYTMTGGTLNVGTGVQTSSQNLRIGDGALYGGGSVHYPTSTGTFTQSGGTVTVKQDASIGRNTGDGDYIISGSSSTILNVTNNLNVGQGNNDGTVGDQVSTFIQGTTGGDSNGPTVNVSTAALAPTGTSNGVSVGLQQTVTFPDTTTQVLPGTGIYTLKSGALNIGNAAGADYLAVGDGIQGTGTFNLEGGSITSTDLVQIGRNDSNNDNRLNMSGGSISAGRIIIGGGTSAVAGRGTMTMTAGTVSGSQATNIGFGNAGGACVGTLDIQGGTYSLTGTGSAAIMAVGNNSGNTGTVKVSGGTLNVNTTGALVEVGRNNSIGLFQMPVGSTGTVNINQFTLNSGTPSAGTATRELRIEGGTFNVNFWEMGSVTPPGTVTRLVNISGGDVNINGGTGISHRAGRLVQYNLSGGTFDFAGNFPLDTSTFTVSGTNVSTFVAAYRNGSGTTNVSGGTLSLNNVNDTGNQGGTWNVSGGTLNATGTFNITSASPSTAGILNLTGGTGTISNLLTSGTVAGSTLYISGGTHTITNLTISDNGILKTDNTIAKNSNVTLGNATINTNSGSLTLSGPVSGNSLTKTGAGTLTLSGTNSYTGATNVNAGTLLVNGNSSAATGAVTVASGATLGGTGTLGGAVTNNGTIAPGTTGIGTLNVAALTLAGGSTLSLDLGAPSSGDLINISSTDGLTISGGSVVVNNAGGLAAGTYPILDYAGTLGGALANLGTPTGPSGFNYSLSDNGSLINLVVSAAAVIGDWNGDTKVNAADYVTWRKDPNSFPPGGIPDGYVTWRENFSQTSSSGSNLSGAPSAVLEPGALALVGLALGMILSRRRAR